MIAYLHMNVMALMFATLIERQLRIAMKRKEIKALHIYPEERQCKYPTTFDIVRLFIRILYLRCAECGFLFTIKIIFPGKGVECI